MVKRTVPANILRRAIAVVLAGAMTMSLIGCNAESKEKKAQREFDEYCDELFVDEMGDNVLSVHYKLADPEKYGITVNDYTLGNFTIEDIEEGEKANKETLDKLKSFDAEPLTDRQQLSLKTLIAYYEQQSEYDGLYMLENMFGTNSGLVANLSINFIEYVFDDEQDVKEYLDLLKDTRRYVGQVLDFTKEQAEKGYFMASFCAQSNIDNCYKYLENDTNPLIASFEEKVDALDIDASKKEEYIATNKEYVAEYFDTAYQDIIDVLSELMEGETNDKGLYYMDGGKDFYTAVVHDKTSTQMTPENIIKLLDSELESLFTEYATLYYSDTSLLEQELNLDPGMSDTKEILQYLADNCTSEFPEPATKDFVVEYQSKATEIDGTVAYYLTARLDQLDYNSIKVNGSAVEGNDIGLYTTLAHEGFPGHLYQFTNVYNNEDIPEVLKLLDFIGFTEGYAEYASDRSYYMLGCSDELSQMCILDGMLGYILQSRVDLGVNYEGWELDDVIDYLSTYINDDGSTSQAIYESVISDPGLLLPYTIGHIKMIKLREKAERKLGDSFDAKEFHQLILDTGIVSFEIMQDELDAYITSKKDSSK